MVRGGCMQPLKTAAPSADLSSRAKRRKAVKLVARLLEQVRDAEAAYLGRIPENLRDSDAYDATDQYIALLDDAIGAVEDIYA